MKKTILTLAFFSAFGIEARPVVSDVSLSQDDAGCVTITYSLSETPTIVTLDILTNALDGVGASVGGLALDRIDGDANGVVRTRECRVRWWPTGGLANRRLDLANMRASLTTWSTQEMPDYYAICLGLSNSVPRFYATRDLIAGGERDLRYKTEFLLMRRIPLAGVATRCGLGSDEPSLNGSNAARETPHWVTFSSDYYMAVYELTRWQHELISGERLNEGLEETDELRTCPMSGLKIKTMRGSTATGPDGWPRSREVDAGSLLGRLRAFTSIAFDLPTHAQWECACRAGTTSAFNNGTNAVVTGNMGETNHCIDDCAWVPSNSEGKAHPVGLLAPNAWGLYDMHGNVDEWVLDRFAQGADQIAAFGPDWRPGMILVDPVGATTGNDWSFCGGAYDRETFRARSAYRNYASADYDKKSLGCRLVSPVPTVD